MSYYSAVAPPSQGGAVDTQSAFAEALTRARQIAAKIGHSTGEESEGIKRSLESEEDGPPEKRLATVTAAFPTLTENMPSDVSRASAAQAAAAVASQINQKLGVSPCSGPPQVPGLGIPGIPGMTGGINNEDYYVPDGMVGLLIGKGGEQTTRIQVDSGAKVQFEPDSNGLDTRACHISGTPDAIRKAKELIDAIISRAQSRGSPVGHTLDGGTTIEMSIPGLKVGLVIGKSGETIKNLQHRSGVKMVMIQENNQPQASPKSLRITGEASAIHRAKQMVVDLMAEKDMEAVTGGMSGPAFNPAMGSKNIEMPVPRGVVGIVIGRSGETIKKLQAEIGVRIQFIVDDRTSPDRICTISGNPEAVDECTRKIEEMIGMAVQKGALAMGYEKMGMGGPFNGSSAGRFTDQFTIPAEKCGLVIGKAGETIREVNRLTGAHIELERNGPNANNRVTKWFNCSGTPEQIQHAIQVINEKTGVTPQLIGGAPGGPMSGGNPYDSYGSTQNYGQPGQQPPQTPAYNQGWNGYQQWGVQGPQQPDPSKQQPASVASADPNAAAWAAYYAQYYQNPATGQTPAAQPQQAAAAAQPQAQAAATVQPTINPATGQPDYSAAWAEYYRSQGMYSQAQAILNQSAGVQAVASPHP